ncbi:MAG: hypothetical protein ACLFNL_08650 [Bacteroidales bacterium]
MKDPIIITGIPRSGTSMIAEIFDICNVFLGPVDKRFENIQIKHSLIKPYLANYGIDILGQRIRYETKDLHILKNWKEDVEDMIVGQGYYDGNWVIKSNLVIPMWPVWYHAFPNAKYIIVRRRTGDIVNSCMKTGYMKAYNDRDGWIHMCRQYIERMAEMAETIPNHKIIWPHRMAYGDYSQVWDILEWTGVPWKTDILNKIDPKFLKIRKNH